MDSEPGTLRDFQDVRIQVPWGHVAGRWYGNRQVRPILAIHGWMDNMGTWDRLLPLLPAHLGVLCIDLPGHGRSSWYPKGMMYHILDYADIIIRVRQEYGWNKVSILAHSLGVAASFLYMAIYPETVDLMISIDLLVPPLRTPDYVIAKFKLNTERAMVEDERVDRLAMQEPPTYTYAEMERLLHEGSAHSVNLENSKYILNRNIKRSTKFPEKYFFSRDGKAKYYNEFNVPAEIILGLAERIHNVPYLVVKSTESRYFNPATDEVIAVLRANNPHFELHEIPDTHHLHLNNAETVAALMVPFINRHRPATLDTWTLAEEAPARERRSKL